MTLVEVIVAIIIIGMFATSAFSLSLQNQKQNLANFYRLEAFRLAQTIAEHAMQIPYTNFDAARIKADSSTGTATAWTWTDTENATLRSIPAGNKDAAFAYPAGTNPVVYTKYVGPPLDATTPTTVGTAKVIQINISWTFAGRKFDLNTNPVDRIYVVLGQSSVK
jgi:type II secretory pathway pseudopilin PulG